MRRNPDLDELLALTPGNAVWTGLDFADLPGSAPLPLVHSYGKYLHAAQATAPGYEGIVLVGVPNAGSRPLASYQPGELEVEALASFALPERLALRAENDSDILLAADVALEAGREALRQGVLARQVTARELFSALETPYHEYEAGGDEVVVVGTDRAVGAVWVFEPAGKGWRVVGVNAELNFDPPLPRDSSQAHRAADAIAERRRRERETAAGERSRFRPAPETPRQVTLSDLPKPPMRSDVLQALVYSPKADRIFAAYGTKNVRISDRLASRIRSERVIGAGSFDEQLIGQCLRTHTPAGVSAEATGQGIALYASLAVIAYQAFGVPCIGSAPAGRGFGYRSPDADRIWSKFAGAGGRPALAESSGVCDGCLAMSLETLIGAGFVVWMSSPGEYEGLLAEAQSVFAEAFAGAEARVSGESVAHLLGELFGRPAEEMQANASRRRLLRELYPGLTDL